jgi:hypothetical protein
MCLRFTQAIDTGLLDIKTNNVKTSLNSPDSDR